MTTKLKLLTIADWDAMPHGDGNRYEIIEGELFVSCSPGLTHQVVLTNLCVDLEVSGKQSDRNFVAGPGVILSNYSGVIPDLSFLVTTCATRLLKMTACTGLHLWWSNSFARFIEH
jgi:Uma2 family endonuclease